MLRWLDRIPTPDDAFKLYRFYAVKHIQEENCSLCEAREKALETFFEKQFPRWHKKLFEKFRTIMPGLEDKKYSPEAMRWFIKKWNNSESAPDIKEAPDRFKPFTLKKHSSSFSLSSIRLGDNNFPGCPFHPEMRELINIMSDENGEFKVCKAICALRFAKGIERKEIDRDALREEIETFLKKKEKEIAAGKNYH